MNNEYKGAPIVKVIMLKGKDGDGSKLSELENDMTFLTREEIITLVNNIVDTGEVGDIDTGFVTRLKEQNKQKALQFWVGTQAEYDALATASANTFYIITDDNFKATTEQAIIALNTRIDEIVNTDVEEEIADIQTRLLSAESDIGALEATSATDGTRITTLENKVDESRYAAGDVDTITFACGGLMNTRGGLAKRFYFDIPLKKRFDSGLTLSLNTLNLAIVAYRTGMQYYVGNNGTTRTFTAEDYEYTVYNNYIHIELITAAGGTGWADASVAAIRGTAEISISNAT